jgi:phosphatidylglycerol phospholipase C
MRAALSVWPEWETALAPRLLVGLWHPAFIAPCRSMLPHCRRSYIGIDLPFARRYFFNECDAFSILFDSLARPDGQA